jgi:pyruvate,water dikinase
MAWVAEIARFFKFGGSRNRRVSLPFKDLFVRFHQVLEENTKAMEIITEMEDKLCGEYVFDRKFLEDTV